MSKFIVGFEVPTAVSMTMAVFWVARPLPITLTMEAANISETSVLLQNYTVLPPRRQPWSNLIIYRYIYIYIYIYIYKHN
jgi:hypothetical protein